MKKGYVAFALALLVVVFTNCNKDCKLRSVDKDEPQIVAYAAANDLDVTKHSSGLYYQVIEEGWGATPTVNSQVSITYKGTLLNGQVFDEQTTPNNSTANPAWPLSGLIEGWKIGLPLIKEGGRIKLIIPSALAYGCEDYYSIPGNSILFFDITLAQVQ